MNEKEKLARKISEEWDKEFDTLKEAKDYIKEKE